MKFFSSRFFFHFLHQLLECCSSSSTGRQTSQFQLLVLILKIRPTSSEPRVPLLNHQPSYGGLTKVTFRASHTKKKISPELCHLYQRKKVRGGLSYEIRQPFPKNGRKERKKGKEIGCRKIGNQSTIKAKPERKPPPKVRIKRTTMRENR